MKVHRWRDVRDAKIPPRRREAIKREVERELLELNLRKVRELIGKTQEETAKLAEMTQSELSRTERRADHLVSTLRRYVEALGGELEVIASFGDRQLKLTGV
jgi:hypothetical protein